MRIVPLHLLVVKLLVLAVKLPPLLRLIRLALQWVVDTMRVYLGNVYPTVILLFLAQSRVGSLAPQVVLIAIRE
jgi:hypothetical protein